MSKTKETKEIEEALFFKTSKLGTFGCFEVTIGYYGKERVDYITYDTKEIFKCYEIKISKSDFHSKCKNSFVGHFNYYVMPEELYSQVKQNIPDQVGVYLYKNGKLNNVKKSKKQKVQDTKILKQSMIRSLYREFRKVKIEAYLSENKKEKV